MLIWCPSALCNATVTSCAARHQAEGLQACLPDSGTLLKPVFLTSNKFADTCMMFTSPLQVKEHHRKQSKAQRKVGGAKKKVAPKDPGIPAQWPFKEELLKELAWEKQRMQADDKARKEARRTAQVLFCEAP